MNQKLNRFVKILILCGMAAGAGLVVYVTAWILPDYTGIPAINGTPGWCFIGSYVLLLLCFAGMEYIAWTLFTMMRTLDRDPFVEANVIALRRMGITALLVMAAALVTLLLTPIPLAVLAAPPVGVCGLFSLVLSSVFERAVAFKQENDLTV